jgi:Transglutaminase-like superfamily
MQSFWSRSRRRFRALGRMSWGDRALAVESLAMLAAARILVKVTPQHRLVSRIGGSRITTAEVPGAASSDLAASSKSVGSRVGASVERVARFTWWRSMCLEKALAGKWMLRRRGIASTMYVGMARKGSEFIAHAWLVGEGQTLTGAGNLSYAPLAAFRERSGSGGSDLGGTDLKRA